MSPSDTKTGRGPKYDRLLNRGLYTVRPRGVFDYRGVGSVKTPLGVKIKNHWNTSGVCLQCPVKKTVGNCKTAIKRKMCPLENRAIVRGVIIQ